MAALALAGTTQIDAATTNVVQNLNFELTFLTQGPTNHPTADKTKITVNKFRVTTKDIIAALGKATTNDFSPRAKLVSVQDATSTNSVRQIEVRDGTNIVDVSSYFTFTTSVSNIISVHSLEYDSSTGVGSGVRYSIFHLTLTNASSATLDLGGFATTTHTSIKDGAVVLSADEVEAAVAGAGVGTNGVPAVVNGFISTTGKTLKVE
jgi:hypothetical protein